MILFSIKNSKEQQIGRKIKNDVHCSIVILVFSSSSRCRMQQKDLFCLSSVAKDIWIVNFYFG